MMKKHERMMMEIGREEGQAIGCEETLLMLICKKIQNDKSLEQIADELEENVETIQPLYKAVLCYAPDFNISDILNEIMTTKS